MFCSTFFFKNNNNDNLELFEFFFLINDQFHYLRVKNGGYLEKNFIKSSSKFKPLTLILLSIKIIEVNQPIGSHGFDQFILT